jgi:hypothetical protein
MQIDWAGQAVPAESVGLGTCIIFNDYKGTQIGIRADQDHGMGRKAKGLVSLTRGYEACPTQPAFFELSILRSTQLVYALPDTTLALPTDRSHVHPGRYGIDWASGALAQEGEHFFLVSNCANGMRYLNLTDGVLIQDWPLSDEIVWFSAWSLVRRLRDEFKTIFEYKIGAQQS